MISIKQLALVTALAGGVTAIWVPGLREHLPEFITGGTQASSSPEIDPLGIETGAIEEFDPDGGTTPTTQRAGQSSQQSSAELLSALRNFKAHRIDRATTTPISVPQVTQEPENLLSKTILEDWVADHPLRGVLISPKGGRAFFGSLGYAAGQQLAPGVTLQSIRPDGVNLELEGEVLWVPLPPLGHASGTSTSSRSATSLPAVDSSDIESEIE